MNSKRLFSAVLTICFSVFSLFAEVRTAGEAQQIANQFVRNNRSLSKSVRPNETMRLVHIQKRGETPLFYVFDRSSGGSVVVSGDTRAAEVLGFFDNGTFDLESMPENCRSWFDFYADELAELALTDVAISPQQSPELETEVEPLLGDIKWNQKEPYNQKCPFVNMSSRAATGCVATAVAQIMYYYQYPERGTGSHSYDWTYNDVITTLYADFEIDYQWNVMTPDNSTVESRDAVATLMFHCGVACDMKYGPSSSATTATAAKALIDYFGYDEGLREVQRNYCGYDEFTSLLRAELDADRPVLYRGSSFDVGHAFVCDGYNRNGFFHFNWGWGGKYDGYFRLSALTPNGSGTGGTAITGAGYNLYQTMYIGIQPQTASPKITYQICSDSTLSVNAPQILRNAKFNIRLAKLVNYSVADFSGSLAAVLYDAAGTQQISILKNLTNFSIGSYKYWAPYTKFSSLSVPNDVPNGNYRLYIVHKANGQTRWTPLRTPISVPNYIDVTVTNNSVIFSEPLDDKPNLYLEELEVVGTVTSHGSGDFRCVIRNDGSEFNSKLGLIIRGPNSKTLLSASQIESILPDSTRTILFHIDSLDLDYGTCQVGLLYDSKNSLFHADNYMFPLGEMVEFELLPDLSETPVLTLRQQISFGNNVAVPRSQATLRYEIENSGGYFDGYIKAGVYKNLFAKGDFMAPQHVVIHKNATFSGNFTGDFTNAVGDYKVTLRWQQADDEGWESFEPSEFASVNITLVDSDLPTEISAIATDDFRIIPDKISRRILIESSGTVAQIRLFDISGRLILHQRPNRSGEVAIDAKNLPQFVLIQVVLPDKMVVEKVLF